MEALITFDAFKHGTENNVRRITFDPFYSKENLDHICKAVDQIKHGEYEFHDLIDD